jgi:polysaccharide export outer membrane protein
MMLRTLRTLPLAALVCLFAAAVPSAQVRPAAPPVPQPLQAAAPVEATPADYRLDVGDAIDIRFFYNAELNESVQIRPDGGISMQLIGDVRVAGHTPASLAQELATKYRDVIKQPAITVQVRSFANRRVFIGGEVARPGVLPLVGVQTAIGAITEAGGLTQRAKRGQILLIRRGDNGAPVMRRISMKSQQGKPPEAASLQLKPLDVVVVMESAIAKTDRAVDQYVRQLTPGLFSFGFSYLLNAKAAGVVK